MPDPDSSAATVHETDVPGLYDVEMPDGSWRFDMTLGQIRSMVFSGTPIKPPVLREDR
jgi:hypothetical protein